MFLSYIKGPNVHEWVQLQVRWLAKQLSGGALQDDEYLYRETHLTFQNAFTDTMTMQKAKHEIQNLKMKEGVSRHVMRGLYFHCYHLLFIACTLTVSQVTDEPLLSHVSHGDST
jgi:hypothetical protein